MDEEILLATGGNLTDMYLSLGRVDWCVIRAIGVAKLVQIAHAQIQRGELISPLVSSQTLPCSARKRVWYIRSEFLVVLIQQL